MFAPTIADTSSICLSVGVLNFISRSLFSFILCLRTSLTHSISVKSNISHEFFLSFVIAFNSDRLLLNPG